MFLADEVEEPGEQIRADGMRAQIHAERTKSRLVEVPLLRVLVLCEGSAHGGIGRAELPDDLLHGTANLS